jgi:hypothetical protein
MKSAAGLIAKFLVVTAAVFAMSATARAGLISLGDITRDTNTGLEWLDVTLTAGQSLNDVMAGPYVANGWSIATTDQFGSLARRYVGEPAFTPTDHFFSLLRGGRAMSLLGCTLSVNTGLCQYSTYDPLDPITFAVLGFLDDSNGASPAGFGSIVLRIFHDEINIMWDHFDDFYDPSRRAPQVGAFLVRTTSVPEPSAITLLVIGLFGIGLARRNKKA